MNENNNDREMGIMPETSTENEGGSIQAAGGRKKRHWLWPVVSAAVCVCLVFTLMFANGVGPFAVKDAGEGSGTPAAPIADGNVEQIDWATAGDSYADLFERISEQQDVQRASAFAAGDMGVESAAADAPLAMAAPAEDMGSAATPGQGTAGSSYSDETPQFPSGGDPVEDGTGTEPSQDESGTGTEPPQGEEGTDGIDPGTVAEPDDTTDPALPEDEAGGVAEDPDDGKTEGENTAQDENEDGEQEAYSETNEQVEGVREADVLKTDGKYIYAINSKNLWIAGADGGEMALVSKISQPAAEDGQVYFEMYVAGDRLIAIRHGYNRTALLRMEEPAYAGDDTAQTCIAYPISGYITDTSVDIFDISDRSSPVKLHTLTQSGEYNSSRMVDGYLYMLTRYHGGDIAQMDGDDPRTFVPLYARDDEQFTPKENDIYLPPGTQWPSYTVISGIDAMGAGDFVSQKSVYGNADTIYVSTGAVYLAQRAWEEEKADMSVDGMGYTSYTSWSETTLAKLSINAGNVEPGAQARVPGYVLNQFSLDEYSGVLRLVTTNDNSTWYGFENMNRVYSDADWARLPEGKSTTTNALYTLDADLNRLGSITDLAPGERVYSCRFMGDIVYFVTFRQTDPLFSVDVSDPSAPKVLGALKIPGFSEYLHPYSDGRLFGLGRDADPETGFQQGLKLTMFDNSDPADVRELHTLVIGDDYSAAEQNHKAILVSADKALIAFPTSDKYLIYGYEDAAGFNKIAEVRFDGGDNAWAEIRGLFIGGTFYVVGPNQVNAYAIDEAFAASGNLTVDEGASSVDHWTLGVMPVMTLPAPVAEGVDVFIDAIE